MKMSAAAVDYKYVYVNYVVAPGATEAATMVHLDDKLSELNVADASFGQFIEIISPPQSDQAQTQLLLHQQQFTGDSVGATFVTPNGETVQYVHGSSDPPTLLMVAQPQDDQLDLLNQDIVSIEEANRDQVLPVEDHLQRLTNELLLDGDHEEPMQLDLDTSCGSLMEESEEEDDDSEHDLTNLAWLSDPSRTIAVNVLAAAAGADATMDGTEGDAFGKKEEQRSTKPGKVTVMSEGDAVKDAKQLMIRDKNLTQERFNKFMLQVQECQQSYINNEAAYRDNAAEKPPFIYAQIIAMAMVERGRMTLKDIEQWIQERFAYYRCTGNWNNSIRHNLSIHFGFTKIARDKNEKGKGGYWELSMNITKGEKKRVRNRSKRGKQSGATMKTTAAEPGATGIKRPRRVTGGGGRMKDVTPKVAIAVAEKKVMDEVQIATEELMKAMPASTERITQMSDGYETACSDGTTSNGYDQDAFASTLIHEGANEIFLGCDIPLSGDCIIIPYTGHTTNPSSTSVASTSPNSSVTTTTAGRDSTPGSPSFASPSPSDYNRNAFMTSQLTAHATLIAHGLTNPTFGPNVIVETMPYGAANNHQAVLDQVVDIERQFSSLVQLPEPELMAEYDAYFDYSGCSW